MLVTWVMLVSFWLRRLDLGLALFPPLFIIPGVCLPACLSTGPECMTLSSRLSYVLLFCVVLFCAVLFYAALLCV